MVIFSCDAHIYGDFWLPQRGYRYPSGIFSVHLLQPAEAWKHCSVGQTAEGPSGNCTGGKRASTS